MTALRSFSLAALLLRAGRAPQPRAPARSPAAAAAVGCSLASKARTTRGDSCGMRQNGELQHLALNAEADAAVFTLTAGTAYRIGRRTPPKEFAP